MKKLFSILFVLLSCSLCVSHAATRKTTFAVGDGTFLLNGKPFVIRAAELHYARIPRAYWDQRIKMCKAMGMNTICMYVFWNFHEEQPGHFNFSGDHDIAAFCRLVQQNGMYVILRPGPYACAEWDMGGLPWWLLEHKDIRLREQDPYFMERAKIYLNQVGKQLSPLQLARGGNILMVQVENEYGAFRKDKAYMQAVEQAVKQAGFSQSLLYQCDWSSNFQDNALPELIWTLNFGSGSNIEQQFKTLKQLRPHSPLMCSEYWSGWFDHWGAKHETRTSQSLIQGMKDMMDRKISFSLYMAHGGTSFGHWAGANNPPFAPTCTSYDYDAPINEAGHTTPKYFEVRRLLAGYLNSGETLPAVPDTVPTQSIPAFRLTEVSPIFNHLSAPKQSDRVGPMSQFGQGWGSILYRTSLTPCDHKRLLTVKDAHDWAAVFVNGKRVGTLNRIDNQRTVTLPPVTAVGATLDIFVEAMGRVNFSTGIYDRKGITDKVILRDGDTDSELHGWDIYNVPVDYEYAASRPFSPLTTLTEAPAYYRGTFDVHGAGDTYLDLSSWGKGMVWVNGHALGRFWRIGPQQTLYLPGCWLREGRNDIIVLDVAGPERTEIAGLRRPILDKLQVTQAPRHRKATETLDLSGETPVNQGEFRPGNGWQTVRFAPAKARFVCLEALSSQAGDDYASIAEINVLDADGRPVSRDNWSIRYADSEETEAANNNAAMIYDLQESTIWHTQYQGVKAKYPHQIVIDLGEEQTVSGLSYLPRPEANYPGMIKDYRIYLSQQGFKY